jgi:hypothetical protein
LAYRDIFKQSLSARRGGKAEFGVLDKGHRDRIKAEQGLLDVIENRLKEF